MATPFKIVQTPACALYTGLSAAGVTATITPYPVDLDGVKLTMTDFGTVATFTVDPKVSGYEEIISFTSITDNGNNTATLGGLTRNMLSKSPYTASANPGRQHGSSAVVVFSDNPQVYSSYANKSNDETITGQWTFNVFPITPSTPLASTSVYGMTRLSVAPVSSVAPIAVGVNDTTIFAPIAAGIPTAGEMPFAGLTVPTGWLLEDASAVSRATYATLFAALNKNQTFTITIASPGVITSNAHGLTTGMRVRLYTTGGLPSGLTANTDYYVISSGLTTNAFELAATPGGAAINTTGSQSGVHTFFYAPHGHGDGSTTFNVPDRRGRIIVGSGTGVKTISILSVAGNVFTASMSVANNNEFQTGQAVVYTAGTAGNLVTATTYYIIRTGNNTFSLATSLANAQVPTVITLAGTETGTFALSLSTRTIGDTGGEENHSQSGVELALHVHTGTQDSTGSGVRSGPGNNGSSYSTPSAGSSTPANTMLPFGVSQWIIKT